MTMKRLISANCVAVDVHASSKKQLFQELGRMLVESDDLSTQNIAVRDIVTAAMDRERLGSTGVGSGVALPHARIDGLDRVYAAFVKLETPLDYDSIDERPVDLVVMLIAPVDAGGAHLRALAQVSRKLRREDVRARLRAAPSSESLYISLVEDSPAVAA